MGELDDLAADVADTRTRVVAAIDAAETLTDSLHQIRNRLTATETALAAYEPPTPTAPTGPITLEDAQLDLGAETVTLSGRRLQAAAPTEGGTQPPDINWDPDWTVTSNATWLAMFAGLQNGQQVQIGTSDNQVITGISDAALNRVVTGVHMRSFNPAAPARLQTADGTPSLFEYGGFQNALFESIIFRSNHTANNCTDSHPKHGGPGGTYHGIITCFPNTPHAKDVTWLNCTFQGQQANGGIHHDRNGTRISFVGCTFEPAANNTDWWGACQRSGPACITMVSPRPDGGPNWWLIKRCHFRKFGQKVNSTGIDRNWATDGVILQIDDQDHGDANPSVPSSPANPNYPNADTYVLHSVFDETGGPQVNHNNRFGGRTIIVGCTFNDASRTQLQTATEIAANDLRDDRGPIVAFGNSVSATNICDIIMVNNAFMGRNAGTEKVALYTNIGYRLRGDHNARYRFPSNDAPPGPTGLYSVESNPLFTNEPNENFRPAAGSPLIAAGVSSHPLVPTNDPLGEPIFNPSTDLDGNTIATNQKPMIGALAPA